VTCYLEHFPDIEPATATFEISVQESCDYPEYWTGCLSYKNLAYGRPVLSSRGICAMPNLSQDWGNLLIYLTDGDGQPELWAQTEVWSLGLYGWLSIELD
jgi:hypothetical protein